MDDFKLNRRQFATVAASGVELPRGGACVSCSGRCCSFDSSTSIR